MTTGMLQENAANLPPGVGPKFRPYASSNHHVTKGRYITSNDPRGYIPVYEYPLNGQWIMMDIDDGYILWTGIWKALGNSKADIVKMIDSQPDLAPLIRRVRGGYLKIQGTWMPYEVALRLARRVAWPIREDLIPLFGPTFPSTCLSPTQPGYGQVVASAPGRRRAPRKSSMPNVSTTSHSSWSVVTPQINDASSESSRSGALPPSAYSSYPPQFTAFNTHPQSDENSYSDHAMPPSRAYARYSPYPNQSPPLVSKPPQPTKLHIPEFAKHGPPSAHENITLPPISPATSNNRTIGGYALPPISALEDLRGVDVNDSAAVLRRLSESDESDRWPTRTTFAQSSSTAAHSTLPPHLTHRFSEPAIRYPRIHHQTSRERLSVSSDDSYPSQHPSPISPPSTSPSSPVTPQSVPFSPQLPVVWERDHSGRSPMGCEEESYLPVSRLTESRRSAMDIDQDGRENRVQVDLSCRRHSTDSGYGSENRQPYRPW